MNRYLYAAREILKGSPTPLSADEISAQAIERGILRAEGKTPNASMRSALYMDIRSNPSTPFEKVSRGRFALRRSPTSPTLERQVEAQNKQVRQELLALLKRIHPKAFEDLVGQLLAAIGFEDIQVTPYSKDNGVDVNATLTVGGLTRVPTAIQVKRWSSNISAATVRELRGSIDSTRQERGLLITTSDFTRDAYEEAQNPKRIPISLVNGERLLDLLVQQEMGVRTTQIPVLTLMPEDLEAAQSVTDNHEQHPTTTQGLNLRPKIINRAAVAQKRAFWPLPGGDYYETLVVMVQRINTNPDSLDHLAEWLRREYPRVTKHGLAKDYFDVPRHAGFVTAQGGIMQVTLDGQRFAESPSKSLAFEIIGRNIFAFNDTLEVVKSEPGISLEQVHERLEKKNGKLWGKSHQVNWRLRWLRALGYVQLERGRWFPADDLGSR